MLIYSQNYASIVYPSLAMLHVWHTVSNFNVRVYIQYNCMRSSGETSTGTGLAGGVGSLLLTESDCFKFLCLLNLYTVKTKVGRAHQLVSASTPIALLVCYGRQNGGLYPPLFLQCRQKPSDHKELQ